VAETGDLCRFQNPRELMGYLGLAPSESSTGDSVKRGGITKAGNGRARRILVEAAWAYRHPARVGRKKQAKVAAAPRRVREIAWKAQTRLCRRFRFLERKGERRTVVATAVARELAAFVWASIARSCKIVRLRCTWLWTARVVSALDRATAPPLRFRSTNRSNKQLTDQRMTVNGRYQNQSCSSEGGTTAGEFPKPIMWPIV